MTKQFRRNLALAATLVLAGIFVYITNSLSGPLTAPLTGNLPSLLAVAIVLLGITALVVLEKRQLLPQRSAWAAAALLLCVITPVVLSGWWPNGNWGISDWDYYFSYHTALRRIVLDYHQFPHWNPYICGGTSGLGDPEFPLFTPTFLLELLFGVPIGLRLSAWLATAVGAIGMLALGRRLKLSLTASFLAALVFSFSSTNLLEIVEGHPNIFSAMWVPWIFWSWLNNYRSTKLNIWSLVCGIFLTLAFFQGGIYMLMYVGIAFLFLIPTLSQHTKSFSITLGAGLWALGFSAVKLIPVFLWLTQFQDTAYASSTYLLPWLHHIVLGRYLHSIIEIIPQQGGGWHEYGAYVGPIAAALILTSLLFASHSKKIKVLALGAILAIILASAGPLLKPLFDQAPWLPRSNVSRFMLFAVLPGALLAGLTLDKMTASKNKLWSNVAATLIMGAVAFDLFTLASALSYQPFILQPANAPNAPPPPVVYTNKEYVTRYQDIDYTRAFAGAAAGFGTMSYCTVLGPPPAVKVIEDESYEGYAFIAHDAGVAQTLAWTPNEIIINAMLTEPSTLILNSNYAKGWKVYPEGNRRVNGKPAQESNNRLAAALPAGNHQVIFKYQAPGFWIGLGLSLVTILAALILLRRIHRDYKVS